MVTNPQENIAKSFPKICLFFLENIFMAAQNLVVENLCRYWVPKYILHRCRELATTFQQRRLSGTVEDRHLKEIVKINPMNTVQENVENDTQKGWLKRLRVRSREENLVLGKVLYGIYSIFILTSSGYESMY